MKTVLLGMIRFYRRYLSPLHPPTCRFIPTCSAYAMEAIEKYGAWKGAGWRCAGSSGATHSISKRALSMTPSPDLDCLPLCRPWTGGTHPTLEALQ